MRSALRTPLPALAALTLLLACGGGSGSTASRDTAPPAPRPKVVVYGESIPTGTTYNYALRVVQEDGTHPVTLAVGEAGYQVYGVHGDRLVYARRVSSEREHYYSVRLDGTGEVWLNPGTGTWRNALLQDGHLVFQNYATGEVYVAPVDGSRPPAQLTATGEWASSLQTTPQGLLYSQHLKATDSYELRFRPFNLGPSVLLTPVTAADQQSARDLVGDRLLYTTRKGLFSIRLDGTGQRQLAAVQDALVYGGVVGNSVIVGNLAASGQQDLYVVSLDGSVAGHALDDSPGGAKRTTFYNTQGSLLTDGTRVVYFNFSTVQPGFVDLYSAPLAGGMPVRLTSFPEVEYAQALRDGKVLVARAADSYQGNWDLLWVPLDGSGAPAPVVQTPQRELFVGFADDRLVFRRLYADREELLSATLDGRDEKRLATVGPNAGDSWSWVAHGRVYVRTEPTWGNYDLHSLKADGTDTRILANSANSEGFLGLF